MSLESLIQNWRVTAGNRETAPLVTHKNQSNQSSNQGNQGNRKNEHTETVTRDAKKAKCDEDHKIYPSHEYSKSIKNHPFLVTSDKDHEHVTKPASHENPVTPVTPVTSLNEKGKTGNQSAGYPVTTGYPAPTWHGFTLEELQRAAGVDTDLLGDPATREAFAFALREERDIARGTTPARFSSIAFCEGCGAIAAPPHLEGERLAACPWCDNRKARRPRPKPSPLLGHDQTTTQPFSESLRPVDWQGIDERMKGPGGRVDHTKPQPLKRGAK